MFLKSGLDEVFEYKKFSISWHGQTRTRWTRSDQFEVWALELQLTVHKDFAFIERPLLEIGTPGQRS